MNQYLEIRQKILQDILDGVLKEGEKLPSEKQLARQFGVSRMTIRQALEALKEERCIITRQGYGSIIRNLPKQVPNDLSKLESIEAMINASGEKLTEIRRIHEWGELNSEEASLLESEAGSPSIRLTRFRAIQKVPVAITLNIFTEEKAPEQLQSFRGSLLALLEEVGKPIDYAKTTIILPNASDPYAESLRGNNQALPIALCRQLHFSWEDEPIFLSYDYLNLNVFSLTITRKRI